MADVLYRVTYPRVAVKYWNGELLRELAFLNLFEKWRLEDPGGWRRVDQQSGLFDPLLSQFVKGEEVGRPAGLWSPSDCTGLL